MQADQGSHRRSLLRLRISPGFGGIILSHEVVPVWFGAETNVSICMLVNFHVGRFIGMEVAFPLLKKNSCVLFGTNP
jgi:hypothetical protein